MSRPSPVHVPVLIKEVIAGLNPQPGRIFVDGTLGGGGHTRVLAERVGESGRVIGLDRDPTTIRTAEQYLCGPNVKLVNANFCDLPEVLAELEIPAVDGVLLDLGLSSDQLADSSRGYIFDADGPLDMRFNPAQGEPAWRLLNRLSAEHLADLIYHYGEERYSRRIGRKIVEQRHLHPIQTAHDLAELVRSCVPRSKGSERIDPATRTFQALRIAVNDELKSLEIALRRIPGCLKPGGRAAVISFHSLEDRRVKEAFRDDPRYRPLTKKPITASPGELMKNPRARSAKLRVAERTDHPP